MSDRDLSAARAQFQDCRLALYLARLLSEIRSGLQVSSELRELVSAVERKNGYGSPVPLVNQTTYLQMANMTLVYPKQGVIEKLVGEWEPNLEWARVEIIEDDRERFPENMDSSKRWERLLQTVRNLLAHSSVEVEKERFVFTDKHEEKSVKVAFAWDFLGELTMEFFNAANTALYPPG